MIRPMPLVRKGARPLSIRGPLLRASLPDVAIGEACELRCPGEPEARRGIVIALDGDIATVSVLDAAHGLSRDVLVMPLGTPPTADMSEAMLGGVFDGAGRLMDRLAPETQGGPAERRVLDAGPVDFRRRVPIHTLLATGVRAIDGLLSCGVGQRVGIFASAGCGKTTLVDMIGEYAEADVFVIALIGERGREVASAVRRLREGPRAARTIVVYATSDAAPASRCNAARLATTIGEYFRDRGNRVLLQVDSVTRYARALRDLALAAGEPPARRGYPASVFEVLPRLLERPGATDRGSLTAFYTVLLEGEEGDDPIGEEVKSLLDGHIVLSRRLAGAGHFPAIDVLQSESRLFTQVAEHAQAKQARRLRLQMQSLDDLRTMRDLGEYRPGESAENDRLVAAEPRIKAFLQQDQSEGLPLASTVEALHALAG